MSAEEAIRSTIQTYFDSSFESSVEKVREAFHPDARITGYVGDQFKEIPLDDYAKLIGSLQPSPKDKGETLPTEVLSIEIAGNTAVTRVRDDFQGKTYLDTLSLVKTDGTWRIYNKLFHIEGDAG